MVDDDDVAAAGRAMAGRTAVVTGAAGGIGAAIAAEAAALDMTLVLADHDAAGLDRVAERLAAAGATVHSVPTDVADADAVDRLRPEVERRGGGLGLLVNNAGIESIGQLWDMPADEWDRVMSVNVGGVFHGIRSFVPSMGRSPDPAYVINVASVAAVTSGPFNAAYFASKHAVLSLTESLYLECAQRFPQIRVSVACPAAVRTDIFATAADGGATTEPARRALDGMRRHLADDGISAEAAARTILDDALRGRFWIPTHPDRFAELAVERAGQLTTRAAPRAR